MKALGADISKAIFLNITNREIIKRLEYKDSQNFISCWSQGLDFLMSAKSTTFALIFLMFRRFITFHFRLCDIEVC